MLTQSTPNYSAIEQHCIRTSQQHISHGQISEWSAKLSLHALWGYHKIPRKWNDPTNTQQCLLPVRSWNQEQSERISLTEYEIIRTQKAPLQANTTQCTSSCQIHNNEKRPCLWNGSRTGNHFLNRQIIAAAHMVLIEIIHAQPTAPELTDSATGDVFFNYNIFQWCLRVIDIQFYSVRDITRQGKSLVHCMAGEKNLADYFNKRHPTSHHWLQRSTYIDPKVKSSKYLYYMPPN